MKFRVVESYELLLEEITESNLDNLYDMEYRFHKMKNSQFNGMPQRYENLLKSVEKHGHRIADNIIDELLEVFIEWFENHDVRNPRDMAYKRMSTVLEDELDFSEVMNYLVNSYKFQSREPMDEYKFIQKYLTYLNEQDVKDHALEEFQRVVMEEYIDSMQDDVENGDMEKSDYERAVKEFEAGDYSYTDELITEPETIQSGVDNGYIDMEDLVTEMYQYLIHPHWMNQWIGGPTSHVSDDIEDSINDLKSSKTITDKFKNINIALNAVHNTGDMLNYIADTSPDITTQLLDHLSNRFDTKKIDDELRKIGFDIK